jgi:hypothetical protein
LRRIYRTEHLVATGSLRDMLRDEKNSDLHGIMSEKLDHITILMQEIIAEGYAKMYWDEEHPDREKRVIPPPSSA